MVDFVIGHKYTFNTRSPVMLGASVEMVTLSAIADFNTAKEYRNLLVDFRAISPTIKDLDTKIKATECQYYIFTTSQGTKLVLADVWIDLSSVKEDSKRSVTIQIPDISVSSLDQLTRVLNSFNIYFTYV
jgi:hypothetical protein